MSNSETDNAIKMETNNNVDTVFTPIDAREIFGFTLRNPLPNGTSIIDLLGVKYAHIKTDNGGDLYLTKHGVKFWKHLLPEIGMQRIGLRRNASV
jgi:hypothetical protein